MLNYNPTNEAFEEGKRAFAAQRYDDAVKSYTRALKTLQADLSAVIHSHRAVAYEKQSKHGLAAEDRRVANLDSNDPHSARTNTEAIPQTASQCDMLAVKYGQALTPEENRNQLLAQILPYEVLSHILSSLSSKDCARLGATCRFWYDLVFHKWPRVWHTVNPEKDLASFSLTSSTRRYIKLIQGEQVRELHLKFSRSENPAHRVDVSRNFRVNRRRLLEDSGDVLLDFMDHRWNGVESLTMHYCTESRFARVSCLVKESLKTLTLTRSNHKSDFGVAILSNAARDFPKLQTMINDFGTMSYTSTRFVHYLEKAAQLSNFQVTSLSIPKYLNEPIDQVFQKSPALKSLTINSGYVKDYAALLKSVHQHCPALEVLNYSSKGTQKLSATHTRSSAATGNGIKTLIIQTLRPCCDSNINPTLASMFRRACRTLQTLDLYLDILENGQFSSLDTLAQIGAPLVQTLVLNASEWCSIGPEKICTLISACPSLVTIKLSGVNFWNDKILDVLASSSKLRAVSIDTVKVYFDESLITAKGIRTFFERTRNIRDFSFNYPDVNYIPGNRLTLDLICAASLSTIRTLDLRFNRLASNTLVRSLEHLKHSRVQTLKIGVACPIGYNEIDAFASIPCLMHLTIYDGDYHIKKDQVCTLLDRWQHPQMLIVLIRSAEPKYYIKGYKGDLATMRQSKDHITDPMIRYSIKSSTLPPIHLPFDPPPLLQLYTSQQRLSPIPYFSLPRPPLDMFNNQPQTFPEFDFSPPFPNDFLELPDDVEPLYHAPMPVPLRNPLSPNLFYHLPPPEAPPQQDPPLHHTQLPRWI